MEQKKQLRKLVLSNKETLRRLSAESLPQGQMMTGPQTSMCCVLPEPPER